MNNPTKQFLTKKQLHHCAKRCFELIDLRGCNALSKGELKEFMVFVHESILINHTRMYQDPVTGKTSDNFNLTEFNKFYDSLEKKVFVVKPYDMQKIVNKLGEDVYDGVC